MFLSLRGNTMRSLLVAALLTLGGSAISVANAQGCEGTPFACAVDDAINAGLQHFRNQERGAGHFNEANSRQFSRGTDVLRETSGCWMGRARTRFSGMDPNDQAMVVRLIANLIGNEQSMTNPNAAPYVYVCRAELDGPVGLCGNRRAG